MTLQLDTTRLIEAAPRARGAGLLSTHISAPALMIDALAIVLAMLVSAVARQYLTVFEPRELVVDSVLVLGPVILGGWIASIGMAGGYQPEVFGAGIDEFKRTLNASLAAAGLVGVGCFLAKFPLSRAFYLITFGLGVVLLLLGRAGYRLTVHALRRRGTLVRRVLISGSSSHVDEVAAVLRREAWLGYEVVGAALPSSSRVEETLSGIPVYGTCNRASSLASELDVDVLLLAGGACDSAGELRRTLWEMEDNAVQVVVAPGVSEVSRERVKVRPVGGLPLVHIDPPTWSDASRWGKRSFDLLGSLLLLTLLSPLLAFAAGWVRLHDGGPVIFRQVRIGRNGQEFDCLKFRSMVVDAEDHLLRLHEEQNYSGGLFKMRMDPRVTAPGRWLRRFSLDELPQLLNVLRGEMSLVGPRPPLPSEVAGYSDDTIRRLRVRPGLTGLWQVSGRSDLSWDESIRLDLYYVDNWSMVQDLSILAKTVRAVTSASGAY